jgi:hypothetical protein
MKTLQFSSNQEFAGDITAPWKEQMDLYRSNMNELAQRLEQQAAEVRGELARSQEFVDKLTTEFEPQIRARLSEAVERAASEFEGAAARAADRRYQGLLEHTQSAAQEALLKLDARSAEVQAEVQFALNSALIAFEQQAGNLVERTLSETKDRAASALASLEAESRAAGDARRQAIESDVARAAERSTDQFRKSMKAFLYSCLVAAVSAVDEHSKSTLDGLLKDNGKSLRGAAADSAAQDEPEILPSSDNDPITH